MEKLKLFTTERIIDTKFNNSQKETEFLYKANFEFIHGCYGLIGEHGSGGGAISYILSGECKIEDEEIIYNENKIVSPTFSEGWYVGNYTSLNRQDRECKLEKVFQKNFKENGTYSTIDEIFRDFHIDNKLLESKISECGWQMWRVSLALGICKNKKVFCFPWINSAYLYDLMINACMYKCLDILKQQGKIIILPTSRQENLKPIIDDYFIINNPWFNRIMSDNIHVKNYFNLN